MARKKHFMDIRLEYGSTPELYQLLSALTGRSIYADDKRRLPAHITHTGTFSVGASGCSATWSNYSEVTDEPVDPWDMEQRGWEIKEINGQRCWCKKAKFK